MTNHKLILRYDEFYKGSLLPGTCKLRIKVARDECTVEVQKEVKKVISEYFNLEKYALIFKGIKEGCIELIYQISHSVKSYMLQHKLNGYDILQLKAHKIIALKFDIMELNIPEDFSDEVYMRDNTYTCVFDLHVYFCRDTYYRGLQVILQSLI